MASPTDLPCAIGTYRYRSPNPDGSPKRLRKENGFVDYKGNRWIWCPAHHGICCHWDVQHRDGDYSNIAPNGESHHGTPLASAF